jgi:hypothetical protein
MDPIDRAIDRLKESRPADAGGSESMLSASEEELLLGRILSDVRSPGAIDNRRHARKRKGLIYVAPATRERSDKFPRDCELVTHVTSGGPP